MRQRLTNQEIKTEIAIAWNKLWGNNLHNRARDFRGNTYYLQAADIEREVRRAFEERAFSKAGITHEQWLHGPVYRFRISPLLNHVRDWLLEQVRRGNLVTHNFNRGHISGARFRPTGQPLSPAEQRTLAEQDKGYHPTYHYCRPDDEYRRAICRIGKPQPRTRVSRSYLLRTNDRAKVNCRSCLKRLREEVAS